MEMVARPRARRPRRRLFVHSTSPRRVRVAPHLSLYPCIERVRACVRVVGGGATPKTVFDEAVDDGHTRDVAMAMAIAHIHGLTIFPSPRLAPQLMDVVRRLYAHDLKYEQLFGSEERHICLLRKAQLKTAERVDFALLTSLLGEVVPHYMLASTLSPAYQEKHWCCMADPAIQGDSWCSLGVAVRPPTTPRSYWPVARSPCLARPRVGRGTAVLDAGLPRPRWPPRRLAPRPRATPQVQARRCVWVRQWHDRSGGGLGAQRELQHDRRDQRRRVRLAVRELASRSTWACRRRHGRRHARPAATTAVPGAVRRRVLPRWRGVRRREHAPPLLRRQQAHANPPQDASGRAVLDLLHR